DLAAHGFERIGRRAPVVAPATHVGYRRAAGEVDVWSDRLLYENEAGLRPGVVLRHHLKSRERVRRCRVETHDHVAAGRGGRVRGIVGRAVRRDRSIPDIESGVAHASALRELWGSAGVDLVPAIFGARATEHGVRGPDGRGSDTRVVRGYRMRESRVHRVQ